MDFETAVGICVFVCACSEAPASVQSPAPGSGGSGAGSDGAGGSGNAGAGATSGGSAGSGGTAPAVTEYYISPDGLDTNPGTEAMPFKTLQRGVRLAVPGTTLWIMPGTFAMTETVELNVLASEAAPVRVWAVPGARPVFDFAGQPRGTNSRGFAIKGRFWHLRGLEVMNAGDNGILIAGSSNTVEDLVVHGNGDTGIQILVSEGEATVAELGADNLVLNCDSYENIDLLTNGENADGFAAKLRIGAGNVFRGCRAWNNADDGWDMFGADDVVTIEDSWAFLNGIAVNGQNPEGDGNGFKLGGTPNGVGQGHAPHVLTRVAAFDNRTCGFNRNNNAESPSLSDCAVGSGGNENPDGDYCDDLDPCSPARTIQTTGEQAKALPRDASGALPALD